jgi:hypothetical protein
VRVPLQAKDLPEALTRIGSISNDPRRWMARLLHPHDA